MKRTLAMVLLLALALMACSSGDPDATEQTDADSSPTESSTVTTQAGSVESGSSTTLDANGESNGGAVDPEETGTDSTQVLQSGSSTSLGPTTTLEQFETDPDAEYAIPAEDIPAGQNPVYYTPFVVEKGDLEVVWDRWWWGLLDGKGDVQVLSGSNVLAEGPISGSGAIQSQDANGTLSIFGPNGDVVATVTQQDLTDAIRTAQAEAGIG